MLSTGPTPSSFSASNAPIGVTLLKWLEVYVRKLWQQGDPCCVGSLDAVKITEALLIYVFRITLTASLLKDLV